MPSMLRTPKKHRANLCEKCFHFGFCYGHAQQC